jgi:hypothetical protein
LTDTPPSRAIILLTLWKRAIWLNTLIDDVENNKKDVNQKLKELIYMSQVHSQICRTILQGMDTQELELRVIKLEEKLKDGVLIPRNEPVRQKT